MSKKLTKLLDDYTRTGNPKILKKAVEIWMSKLTKAGIAFKIDKKKLIK